MLLTFGLSVFIGSLLGLLGGGGSILTVPMLVYVLHVEPKLAIVTSFVVVGVSSVMALASHARRGSVCWKSGIWFGLTGMLGAFGGGRLAAQLSGDVLLSLFGGVGLLAGVLMLHRRRVSGSTHQAVAMAPRLCPLRVPLLRLSFDGLLVGAMTGAVGVGGGFVIVPALTLLVRLPMPGAVGTSLLVIAMNAVAGLGGYSQHVTLDFELTGLVLSGAVVGSLLGSRCSNYIKPAVLRQIFGLMVILVAAYVLSQTLSTDLLSGIASWLTDSNSQGKTIVGVLLMGLFLQIGYWIHRLDRVVFR